MTDQPKQTAVASRSRACSTCGNEGDWFPCILAGHDVPAPKMCKAWEAIQDLTQDGKPHLAWRVARDVAIEAECATRTVENLIYWGIKLGYLKRGSSMNATPTGKIRKVKTITRKAEQE